MNKDIKELTIITIITIILFIYSIKRFYTDPCPTVQERLTQCMYYVEYNIITFFIVLLTIICLVILITKIITIVISFIKNKITKK